MKTLCEVDMRRIVNGGERFLLLDLTDESSTVGAIHIPFDDAFAANVVQQMERPSLPIIIRGTASDLQMIERAAEALRGAGCLEVWTYFHDWPAAASRTVSASRHNVVSDPDAGQRASHGQLVLHR